MQVLDAVDPEIITWENLGQPKKTMFLRYFSAFFLTAVIFVISFFGLSTLYNSKLIGKQNNLGIAIFIAFINLIL